MSDPGSNRIASDVPGRMRVRLPSGKNDHERLEQLQSRLHALEGVSHVRVRHEAGSVLVHYDPAAGTRTSVISEMQSVGFEVASELKGKDDFEPTDVGSAVVGVIGKVNASLARSTGRRADLRLLAPLVLGAWGVYRFSREGWTYPIPAYLFIWWAFDLFWKGHVESRRRAPEPGSQPV